jgi:hypothetical protein
MADTLTPLRIAQFFALPGAAELVDAFSAIPPGPVRESIVLHAQALAAAQSPQPQAQRQPPARNGALLAWQGEKPPPEQRQAYVSASMEGRIVERALRGESVRSISEDTGIAASLIEKLKEKARREGRVIFPSDKPREKQKPKPTGGRYQKRPQMPLPEPPWWWEDPASPLWESPWLLPGHTAAPDGTLAVIGPNDRQGFAVMTKAAEKRGMSLRQYVAMRKELFRRVLEDGETVKAAALALGEEPHACGALLARAGQGIMQRIMDRQVAAAVGRAAG